MTSFQGYSQREDVMFGACQYANDRDLHARRPLSEAGSVGVHRGTQAALGKVQGYGPAARSAQTTAFYAKPVTQKSAEKQGLSE